MEFKIYDLLRWFFFYILKFIIYCFSDIIKKLLYCNYLCLLVILYIFSVWIQWQTILKSMSAAIILILSSLISFTFSGDANATKSECKKGMYDMFMKSSLIVLQLQGYHFWNRELEKGNHISTSTFKSFHTSLNCLPIARRLWDLMIFKLKYSKDYSRTATTASF